MDYGKKAKDLFNSGYNCSQAIVLAFKDVLKIDEKTLASLASSFGGGISRLRITCGCISGMAIVLGLLEGSYDINNVNEKGKHYQNVQKLALEFEKKYQAMDCASLLNLEHKPSSPIPEARSKDYYASRPCGNYIEYMANLIGKYLDGKL